MDNKFTQNLFRIDRWKKKHEVLNVIDVNLPPLDYNGSQEEWIQDITTFSYLNPSAWKILEEEYQILIDKEYQTLNKNRTLDFYRTEEGELRIRGEKDIYLRVQLEQKREDLQLFIKQMKIEEIMGFYSYCFYIKGDKEKREKFKKSLEYKMQKRQEQLVRTGRLKESIKLKLSFEENLDTSLFEKQDIYLDALNHEIILL